MSSEVDPDLRSQNTEYSISAHQMRLLTLVLTRKPYTDDNPRPVIKEAMPALAKSEAYATPWLMEC
jgi:hypothetical protein